MLPDSLCPNTGGSPNRTKCLSRLPWRIFSDEKNATSLRSIERWLLRTSTALSVSPAPLGLVGESCPPRKVSNWDFIQSWLQAVHDGGIIRNFEAASVFNELFTSRDHKQINDKERQKRLTIHVHTWLRHTPSPFSLCSLPLCYRTTGMQVPVFLTWPLSYWASLANCTCMHNTGKCSLHAWYVISTPVDETVVFSPFKQK